MILTREEALQKHREMWNWLADQTEAQKRIVKKVEYFEAQGIPTEEIRNYCFLCTYTMECLESGCKECPVVWFTPYAADTPCWWDDTWFDKWYRADNWQEAAEYARKIAQM